MAVQVGVPAQAVALLLVAAQPQVRVADAQWVRLARVLAVVEDEDVGEGRLGGDHTRILWHEARAVHLGENKQKNQRFLSNTNNFKVNLSGKIALVFVLQISDENGKNSANCRCNSI